MTGVKAKLKVVLQADDTVVAESEDAGLWQRVLMAINKGAGDLGALDHVSLVESVEKRTIASHASPGESPDAGGDEAVARFAKLLGLDVATVVGACAPSQTSPYLTLDMHCWNSLKDQTPSRGPGSVSPLAIAATLLALWMQAAKLGNVSQGEAQKVLSTINLRDANPTRSIRGADWLQARSGGVIVVNPARIKRAIALARAFCAQDWRSDTGWKGSVAE
jgi:hypothetical protein